jgi:hypothetical protein
MNRFTRGGKSPHGVIDLCQQGIFLNFRWKTRHKCPNLNRDAGLCLFVDQSACREGSIIEVRGKVDPSHEVDLIIVAVKEHRF